MKKKKSISLIISLVLIMLTVLTNLTGLNDYTPKASAAVTNLYINGGNVIYDFKPEMLGANVGIWDSQSYNPTLDSRLANLVTESGIKLLRFPAGGEADIAYFDRTNTYQWHTGPAPYTRTLRASQLDAFMNLCIQTGAEPLIVVNARIDNEAMAADIVRYLNVEHNYGVKYFEIGNEPQYWGTYKIDYTLYAQRMARYIEAMKAVDPSIIVANAAGPQPNTSTLQGYMEPVLIEAGDKLDALTVHWYPLYDGVTDPSHPQYPTIDHLLALNFGGTAVDKFMTTNTYSMTKLRDQYSPGALLGITELNTTAGDDSTPGVANTLANALWMGDVIGALAYNKTDFMTLFLLQSSQQGTMTDKYFTYIKPHWYTYVMYDRYFGDKMVETATDNRKDLVIWASKKAGVDNKLYVMVVNKNTTSDLEANIEMDNFNPTSSALKWVLNGADISSTSANINGVSVSSNVTLPSINGQQVSGVSNNFNYTFPAHSITCFEFTKNTSSPTSTPIPTATPVPTLAPTATPAPTSTPGQLINMATDSFTASDSTYLVNYAGGSGFNGNWKANTTLSTNLPSNEYYIMNNQMTTVNNIQYGGASGQIIKMYRGINEALDFNADGDYYLQFKANARNFNGDTYQNINLGGRFAVGYKRDDATAKVYPYTTFNGTVVRAANSLVANANYTFVVHISAKATGSDTIRVKAFNNDLGEVPTINPGSWDMEVTHSRTDSANYIGMEFKNGSGSATKPTFDELQINKAGPASAGVLHHYSFETLSEGVQGFTGNADTLIARDNTMASHGSYTLKTTLLSAGGARYFKVGVPIADIMYGNKISVDYYIPSGSPVTSLTLLMYQGYTGITKTITPTKGSWATIEWVIPDTAPSPKSLTIQTFCNTAPTSDQIIYFDNVIVQNN